jgi:alkylation response protein AidB-like acyl-CoA dehydrogenase
VEEAALHHALLPEAAGGYGVPTPDALSLLRVAGEYTLPLPFGETMIAAWLLATAGLPVAPGPLTFGPVGASDALTLSRHGDRWSLSGVATRIPWGRHASAAALLVQREERDYIALVPAVRWSAECAENIAREPRDTLRFAAILERGMVAPCPAGIGLMEVRALGAAMRSLQIAGALTRVAALTTEYAQQRIQFGRPIGKFQAVQQSLALLAGQTAAAVAAADLAAEAVADNVSLLPIATAKSRTGEAAGIGAAIAHQVHGAIGFTYEHSLHFFTKRLWSWRNEFGSEAEWNLLTGSRMCEAGADEIWAEITRVDASGHVSATIG